jgi:hypothetical protein
MTAKYDFSIIKGSNYDLWVQYLTDGNTAVNLASYGANMTIKRYKDQDYSLLYTNIQGLTYGYTGPNTNGLFGSGGVTLNRNYDGSALTGGIKITLGSVATNYFDYGKYFYDVNLTIGTTYNEKLLEGRITFE